MRIATSDQALLHLQEKVRKFNKGKLSLVDDLLVQHHKEALDE